MDNKEDGSGAEIRSWSAKIPPKEMAIHICNDLFKKFRQLDALPEGRVKRIAEGLVDGLKDVSFPHPMGGDIPNYLKSMEPDYCAGWHVGSTWRRVANEWSEKLDAQATPLTMDWEERHASMSPSLILDKDNGVDFTSKGMGLKGNRR